MPTQQEKDNNFDFLTKFQPTTKTSSLIHRFMKYCIYNVTGKKIATSLLIAATCFAIVEIPYWGYKLVQENHAENQIALNENTKYTQEIYNNNVKLIKSITPEEMQKTIAFIHKTQAKETNRLTQLYWKIKFLETVNPQKYVLNKFVGRMANMNSDMVLHYTNRATEINLAYNLIQSNNNFVLQTYDGQDILKSILYWKNAAQIDSTPAYQDINKFVIQWDEDFSDQAGLAKYLSDNKELISSTTIFN